MNQLMKEIGERVRQARLARGLSQADLADMVGTSTPYISNIETGKHTMKISVLVKISEALEVSTDWLLRNRTREAMQYTAEEFDKIFNDCTPAERQAMMDMLEALKQSLRNVKASDLSDN